jgi:hypothetical protein
MARFDHLWKPELRQLADGLLYQDPAAIEQCVIFFEAETRGFWHNRARALIARRLKHCPLTREQRARLLRAVLGRLANGNFTEQFKDQLRLALHLDREQVAAVARACESSPKEYVRRYAAWVLAHQGER